MIGAKIKFKAGVTTDDGEIDLSGTTGTVQQFIHSRKGNLYFVSADILDGEQRGSVSLYREDFEVVS